MQALTSLLEQLATETSYREPSVKPQVFLEDQNHLALRLPTPAAEYEPAMRELQRQVFLGLRDYRSPSKTRGGPG